MRHNLLALAISGPIACFVVIGQLTGTDGVAHASALAALVLGLPWVAPALVVVAVASAPVYVALHVAGQPYELMPWLSGVILVAAVLACHVNAMLLVQRLHKRRHAPDAGLAEFLFRAASAAS